VSLSWLIAVILRAVFDKLLRKNIYFYHFGSFENDLSLKLPNKYFKFSKFSFPSNQHFFKGPSRNLTFWLISEDSQKMKVFGPFFFCLEGAETDLRKNLSFFQNPNKNLFFQSSSFF